MILKRYINISAVIMILLLNIISCTRDDTIILKNWEILQKQCETPESASKETGWEPVKIPSKFTISNPDQNDYSYAWLRTKFNIDNDPSIYYGIGTGRISLFDAIYINNLFIGSLNPKKIYWTPVPRNYPIPAGTIRKGENEIYIMIGAYRGQKGGVYNDIVIANERIYDITEAMNNLISNQLPAGILVTAVFFILPLFIIFFWNRKEKLILFGLMALCIYILYIITLLTPHKLINFQFFTAIQMSITPLVFISFILIIQSIYRIFLSNYNRIIVPLLLLFVLIILLNHESSYYYQIGFALRLLSVIICVPFFIFLIYKLNKIYPDKFLLKMIILMAIISTIIIVIETYLGTTGGRFTDILGIFSPVFYITIFAVLISREIMKRRLELEFSYDKLKRYEGHEKELSITDTSEEKLKRVIDFIHENYTSDLSREGLAAAVGINPNYMGSLFKTYTGKTINEYINFLRIEDAVKQLKEKNKKITDIAFSIGFESLVTFNRVFKKVKGKTPTEYRDEKK